ncbi:MAG TPA: DUF4145 domain-containing protein [Inquilinus sp.]
MSGFTGLRLSTNLKGLRRCPHCGIANPQLIRMTQPWSHVIDHEYDPTIRHWVGLICTSCKSVVMACGHKVARPVAPKPADGSLDLVSGMWPELRTAPEELPPQARSYLNQAYETLSAPDAAAVMAASAVDAMLKKIGYSKGTLNERIDKAVQEHKLTEDMGRWAHHVRLEANRPRHADDQDPHVTPEEARQAVEFAEALGEFLFVLSARVTRGLKAAGASTPTP